MESGTGEHQLISYRHTPAMGQISGLGGEFEQSCQEMLQAGVAWIEAQRESGRNPDPIFALAYSRWAPGKETLLLTQAASPEAKTLEAAMRAASTGAEDGAFLIALQSVMWILDNDWSAYVGLMERYTEAPE